MNRRLFSIILVITLVITLFPLNVFAGNSVILNTIANKYPGDSVTITGTTVYDEVTIKVLRPNNTILYVNVLNGGNFSDTFILPDDTVFGSYTVIVGKGQDVATGTFNVIPRSSGTIITAPVEKDEVDRQDDGTVKVTVKTSIDKDSNMAVSIISVDTMQKALQLAERDFKGIKTVVFRLPEVEGAEKYSIQLPSSVLSSGDKSIRLEIETPIGNIVVPGNMFNKHDLEDEEYVELIIGLADMASVDENIRQQIGNRPVVELNARIDGEIINWNNPDAHVTVSIPYTPTAEELSGPEHIVVWYIDGQGNVTSVPNGRYNPETGKVTFKTNHFSKYAIVFVKKTFSDIEDYSWAQKQIEVLASKGIINGTSATTYSPGLYVTRADFITLLTRALEIKADFSKNFDDVKSTDYYYNAIGVAKELGIAVGTGNNKFNPNQHITRQDMMVLILRALKIADINLSEGSKKDIDRFIDTSSVSDYALEAVATLVKEGIIIGSNNKIRPKEYTTRAETAVMIYRIYKLIESRNY